MKINKVAGAALLAVATAGSMFVAVGASASTPRAEPAVALDGKVTVTPSTNLVNGQVVNVTASNFPPTTTTLYITECGQQALITQNSAFCDTVPADSSTITPVDGAGTGTYNIRTGSNFHPGTPPAGSAKAQCDFAHNPCYLIVADGATADTTNHVGFAQITFKDTRVATTTKVTGKKSGKVGSKEKLTITTTHAAAALTGKVTVKDGSKKVATLTEKSSGKLTVKVKLKKGANKITASYGGSSSYKASAGKLTVTGKKK